jgi:tRNA dimethylallyltransferase
VSNNNNNGNSFQIRNSATVLTRGVSYRLLGSVEPARLHYRVGEFVQDALPWLRRNDDNVAFVVGGTHYYVEALLWNALIGATDDSDENAAVSGDLNNDDDTALGGFTSSADDAFLHLSPAERYAELARVDPVMAAKLHPNDIRKVIRALQLFHRTGVPQSSMLVGNDASLHSGELRAPRTCVLWVDCEQTVLDARTDARVDRMLRSGLLDELVELRATLTAALAALSDTQRTRLQQTDVRFPFGVAQAIGYKEFTSCFDALDALTPADLAQTLAAVRSGGDTPFPAALGGELVAMLEAAVVQVKINTRRYARSQRKWIRKRFLARQPEHQSDAAVFRFDSSDSADFELRVVPQACEVVRAFLARTSTSVAPVGFLPNVAPSSAERVRGWAKHRCEVCDREMNGAAEWSAHLASNAHRMAVRRQKQPARQQSDDNDHNDD